MIETHQQPVQSFTRRYKHKISSFNLIHLIDINHLEHAFKQQCSCPGDNCVPTKIFLE